MNVPTLWFIKNTSKFFNNLKLDTDLKFRIISFMSLVRLKNQGNTSVILQMILIFMLRNIECMTLFDVS